ncbi:MAG: protein kinase [Crocinitomicaceae bacterium]
MNIEIPEGYTFIKILGAEKTRKYNQVALIKNNLEETFVLKSCPLSDENGCALLLREFQFNFEDEISLPQKSILDKTSYYLHLILPFKKGVLLQEHWKSLKKKERTSFLLHFIPTFLQLIDKVHQNGVYHNDIRPGNILIDEETIHLIDFGMASKQEEAPRKTLFSLSYSSPELILNQLSLIDETSDLYSFGMLLIELISGKTLFTHENPAVLTQLAITYPVKLKGIVPKELEAIIEKMCGKPIFKTTPNKIPKEELVALIKATQAERKIEKTSLENNFKNALENYQKRRKNRSFSRYQVG